MTVPYDHEAEEATLAACMVDRVALESVLPFLRPQHFQREKNAWIFEAILEVYGRGETPNQITVAHELSQRDRLAECGGQTFLAEIIRALPTAVGAEFYGRIVARMAGFRELISLAQGLMTKASAADGEPADLVASFVERLLRNSVGRERQLTRSAEEILRGTEDKAGLAATLLAFIDQPDYVDGVPLGWAELDGILGGLGPTRLYTVLADTSVGKSFFVHFAALSIASQGYPVHLVSTEMSGDEVIERMVYMHAGVDPLAIRRTGGPSEWQRDRLMEAQDAVYRMPIYVTDVGRIGLDTLVAEARRQRSLRGTEVLFVDHVQDVTAPTNNRAEGMEQVQAGLKGLAMNLDLPVVQVSHISREDARNRTIGLHSGKWGSAIEQWSNVVLTLEVVKFDAGIWAPMTEEEADVFKGRYEYLPVRVKVPKNRRGAKSWDVRVLDWNLGGRFVPRGEGYQYAIGGAL